MPKSGELSADSSVPSFPSPPLRQVALLGVRTFTAGPDTRYIESFPTDM